MQGNELTVQRTSAISLLNNDQMVGNINSLAQYMATGDMMTPDHFKGKPADCFMLSMQALQWGMNPVSVMAQAFPIKGRLTYGAPLVIAIILQSGMVEPRPYFMPVGNWENKGNLAGNRFQNEAGLGVKVGFKFIGDSQPTYTEAIYLADQVVRNSPLWQTDPYQQLCYIGAKRWSNLYMPGATMGLHIANEQNEAAPVSEKDITPAPEIEQGIQVDLSKPAACIVEVGTRDPEEANQVQEDAPHPAANLEQEAKSADPSPGDLDDHGTQFNPDIHSGTKLKDGSWRLNKKGRELLDQSQETEEPQIEECEPQTEAEEPSDFEQYVVAIQKEAISILGQGPLFVEEHNETANTVRVNGQDYPVSDGETVYLAFCNEDGDQLAPASKADKDNPFA